MRIVIVNDYLIKGGTEVQCLREKEIFEKQGYEVFLLTFDYNYPDNHELYNEENGFYNIPIKARHRSLVIDKKLLNTIKNILDKISPDVIHANNLILAPATQYRAFENYKVVQTLRDYSAVCVKATCMKSDLSICSGYLNSKCMSCSEEIGTNLMMAKYKLSKFNRIQNLRFKYVKAFITPSKCLKEYCENNGYRNVQVINDAINLEMFKDVNREFNEELKNYLYIGNVTEIKGIFKLLDEFNSFSKNKNLLLTIAGACKGEDLNKLNKYIESNDKIKYVGLVEYNEVISLLSKSFAVIVPSLWMENYPNTVLEAMASRCLVLGSTRGGIPEMISECGYIFDILNSDDILKSLNESYEITSEDYEKRISLGRKKIENNNNADKYFKELDKLFKKEVIKH